MEIPFLEDYMKAQGGFCPMCKCKAIEERHSYTCLNPDCNFTWIDDYEYCYKLMGILANCEDYTEEEMRHFNDV